MPRLVIIEAIGKMRMPKPSLLSCLTLPETSELYILNDPSMAVFHRKILTGKSFKFRFHYFGGGS